MQTVNFDKIYITMENDNTPCLRATTSDSMGHRLIPWGDLLPLYINIVHHLTDTPIMHSTSMRDYPNIHIAKHGKGYILTCRDDGVKLMINKPNLLSLFLDITCILGSEAEESKPHNTSPADITPAKTT